MMNTFHFIGLVGGAGAPESWMAELLGEQESGEKSGGAHCIGVSMTAEVAGRPSTLVTRHILAESWTAGPKISGS
jgi:hypothetical protein